MNVLTNLVQDGHHTALATSVRSKELKRIQSYLLLALSDIAALTIGFLAANVIYWGHVASSHGVVLLAVILPIYLTTAALLRAYNGDVLERLQAGITRSVQAAILAAAAVLLIVYFLKASSEFSRASFGIGLSASIALLAFNRYILLKPILNLLGGTPYTTVVISDGVEYSGSLFDIVLNAQELQFDPNTTDPNSYHTLATIVADADRVLIACPTTRYAQWSSVLKGMAIDGEIIADDDDKLGIIGIGQHCGRRTMVVAAGPLHLRDRILKRAFDLFFSAIGIVVLSPVLIGTAIAIKRESKGPVFFVQSRIGRDNRLFRVYKFRSMYTDMCDENGSQSTLRHDSRITRVGEFIRRTSIDELPQLFNVLAGDMSIVGPRPHPLSAKAANKLFWDVDPRYRHRHSMKPGVTGLAQVRGYRGATEKTEDLTNRLDADLEYMSNWSIWRDLKIIVQTFTVLRHENAF